ncbi:hypothetical protein BDW71DRAFT_209467 [Aspergillus fruticulosus]
MKRRTLELEEENRALQQQQAALTMTSTPVAERGTPTAASSGNVPAAERDGDGGGSGGDEDDDSSTMVNPLSCGPPKYITDSTGRPREAIGHTSNWSLTIRLLQLAHQALYKCPFPSVAHHIDTMTYSLLWDGLRSAIIPDLRGRPSLDHALFLINATKFPIIIVKFQIGLGVLSLPSTFHVLGLFPGVTCFAIMALMASVAGYVCGNARQYYPYLHGICDAAELLFGKGERELVGIINYVNLALVSGAGMLTTSVALKALSEHGTCTMAIVAAGAVGVAGTIVAIWMVAIACITQSRPQVFTRSLACGQSFIVITGITIAFIIYGKVGQFLASPALGSASPLIMKISYGIALPGLVVSAVLYSHIAVKYCFVHILRGTPDLQSNTVKHWTVRAGSILVGAPVSPEFTNIIPGFMILFFLAVKPGKAIEGVRRGQYRSR